MTCHLHWLYRKGPQELRGVTKAASLCGKMNLSRAEVTAFVEDADCPRCLELARQTPDDQADKLCKIAALYRTMPNRGAPLSVSNNGVIGNGIVVIAEFASRSSAEEALRRASFEKRAGLWKLSREAQS